MGLRDTLTGPLVIYCIVSEDVISSHAKDLQVFGDRIGVNLVFCPENKAIFDLNTGAVSEISYQKFLFPILFPNIEGKLLYLDIDIVPIQNFDDLFSTNFSVPFAAAALDDIISKRKSKNWKFTANGGVQLFNTDAYREDQCMTKSIDFYHNHSKKIKLTDETVLNSLNWKLWFDLGSNFNMPYTKTWYTWKPKKRNEIKLVHFIGPRKPWKKHITSPLSRRFLRVYQEREQRYYDNF